MYPKEPVGSLMYPKYYKNSKEIGCFLFLVRLGHQESTENFCNFVSFFEGVFFIFVAKINTN